MKSMNSMTAWPCSCARYVASAAAYSCSGLPGVFDTAPAGAADAAGGRVARGLSMAATAGGACAGGWACANGGAGLIGGAMTADGGSGAGGAIAARFCGAGAGDGVMAAGSDGSGAGSGDITAGAGGSGAGTGDVDDGGAGTDDRWGVGGWPAGAPSASTFVNVVASAVSSASARRCRRARSSWSVLVSIDWTCEVTAARSRLVAC